MQTSQKFPRELNELFDIARDFFSCFVFGKHDPSVFLSVSKFSGLVMCAFMPASSASCTSLTKTLAVMAMTGMLCASGWSEARMSRVGQTVSLKKPSHREKLFDG